MEKIEINPDTGQPSSTDQVEETKIIKPDSEEESKDPGKNSKQNHKTKANRKSKVKDYEPEEAKIPKSQSNEESKKKSKFLINECQIYEQFKYLVSVNYISWPIKL